MHPNGNTCRRIPPPLLSTGTNGPQTGRVWTPNCVACMHYVQQVWIWVDVGVRPYAEGVSHFPFPGQLLSCVHVCTLPLGLISSTRNAVRSFSAFPRHSGRLGATACRRRPSCSCKIFLGPCQAVYTCRASSLGASRGVQGVLGPYGSQNNLRVLPPFPNQTRLGCATNLNITPLISQARDLKPAVGLSSSVLPAQYSSARLRRLAALGTPLILQFQPRLARDLRHWLVNRPSRVWEGIKLTLPLPLPPGPERAISLRQRHSGPRHPGAFDVVSRFGSPGHSTDI